MRLMKMELRKMVRRRTVIAALLILLAMDLMLFLIGDNSYYSPLNPEFDGNLAQAREQGRYFKGPVTDAWIEKYTAEAEEMRMDHPELTETWDYGKYEAAMFSAGFYDFASRRSESLQQTYKNRDDSRIGELLAEETARWYSHLTDGTYTIYYNYDIGWQVMEFMLSMYPYILGVFIAVSMSAVFCGEYAKKTDALRLSCRYGKTKLIRSKIGASFCLTVGAWLLFTLFNAGLCIYYYGLTGGEAFWQDWIYRSAPWRWNQLTAMGVSLATSLMGSLCLCSAALIISALVKTTAGSMLLSLALTLLPVGPLRFGKETILGQLMMYLPSRLMQGDAVWQEFHLRWLLGRAVPEQAIILTVAAAVFIVAVWGARQAFRSHQVTE